MKRKKKIFYTLLYIVGFISFWLMPLQALGSIKLDGKRLSAKDGLSCNTVNDIIQDRDGFIWLTAHQRRETRTHLGLQSIQYPLLLRPGKGSFLRLFR